MDKYDHAIAYLKENPDQIPQAWLKPESHIAGCLFDFAEINPRASQFHDYGCLTQIRGRMLAESEFGPEHTTKIRQDERIPAYHTNITVESLDVFAEYQREMDNMRGEQNV